MGEKCTSLSTIHSRGHAIRVSLHHSFVLRELGPEDAHIFHKLRLSGLNESPESFGAHESEWKDLHQDEIVRRMGCETEAFVLGAFSQSGMAANPDSPKAAHSTSTLLEKADESNLIGLAGFRRHKGIKTQHCGSVWGVYTDPKNRGKGVAKALMIELLARARRIEGLEKILLAVTSHNTAALKLYEGLQFKTYGFEKHALKVGEQYVDEYLMSLALGTEDL